MRKNLVNEAQVFGVVHNTPMFPTTIAKPADTRNSVGATTQINNHGQNHVESFADKNPGAYAQACRGRDNPFGPVGKSFKSKVNLTDGYSNAN